MSTRGKSQDNMEKQLRAILDNMLTKDHFDDEMNDIKNKLSEHDEKIKTIDERLTKIEDSPSYTNTDHILEELHEQERRKKSIIIFNLAEQSSPSNSKAENYQKELKLITELCVDMQILDSTNDRINIRFTRIGKNPNPGSPRPMKVTFGYTAIREQVFHAAANLKGNEKWKNVSINLDLTKAQLKIAKRKTGELFELAKIKNESRSDEDKNNGVLFKVRGHYGLGNLRIQKTQNTFATEDANE